MSSITLEVVDNIYRSRITLLKILDERGYDVSHLIKFSPVEISAAAISAAAFSTLGFVVKKKENENDICRVEYAKGSRQSLEGILNKIDMPEDGNLEIVFMILDAMNNTHHEIAASQYLKNKLKVSIFSIPYIVFDPREHILVPKHELVSRDDHKRLLEEWNLTSKGQMPMIRYHIDPIVRILGASPGDIIKITRPSPSAGEYIIYRVVTL